jgi:hypothetical protein
MQNAYMHLSSNIVGLQKQVDHLDLIDEFVYGHVTAERTSEAKADISGSFGLRLSNCGDSQDRTRVRGSKILFSRM